MSAGSGNGLGVALVIGGAMLLSSKGIFAKLMYAAGVDPTELVTVRTLLSLPVFWVWGWLRSGRDGLLGIPARDWAGAALAGFACYYAGALLDFIALTMISAAVERVVLFSYPALVVIAHAVMARRMPAPGMIAALLVTYAGVVLVAGGHDAGVLQANLLGTSLVLLCAVTLALYFLLNEHTGRRIGSAAFTVHAMTVAAVALGCHWFVTRGAVLPQFSTHAWWLMAVLVVAITALPIFMVAEGVKRIGAPRAAVLSTVGPVSTFVLAWLFLGERLAPAQLVGGALVVVGIVVLELRERMRMAAAAE